jgi:hypothetical protein
MGRRQGGFDRATKSPRARGVLPTALLMGFSGRGSQLGLLPACGSHDVPVSVFRQRHGSTATWLKLQLSLTNDIAPGHSAIWADMLLVVRNRAVHWKGPLRP